MLSQEPKKRAALPEIGNNDVESTSRSMERLRKERKTGEKGGRSR